MVHSEFMFFEILDLYFKITGENKIEFDKLEKAFYTLQDIIESHLGISISYAFLEELEKLVCDYQDLFYYDEEKIGFADADPSLIRDEILFHLKDENLELDYNLYFYVQNMAIYRDLNIYIPLENYQDLFNTSCSILQNYLLLARQESILGSVFKPSFLLTKSFWEYFEELYCDLAEEDIIKIKVIITELNDLYFSDIDNDYVNQDWYIALFSKGGKEIHTLQYNRISQLISLEEENYCEYEEDIDDLVLVDEETPYLDDEVTFFLTYYLALLNQNIKIIEPSRIKEYLTLKKYLLICILPDIEDYYFEKETIDTFTLPHIEMELLSENSFLEFFLLILEIMDNFNVKDSYCNDEAQSLMIISALFIRSFLDLSIHEEKRKEIIDRLVTSDFYKNPSYMIASKYVDEFIFKDKGFSLNRNIEL